MSEVVATDFGGTLEKHARRACVTLDVDSVRHYHAIHGVPLSPSLGDPMIERGVRRFLEVVERLGVASTLFVVGADLDDDAFRSTVFRAARDGHEIASHSYAHRYDLSLQSARAIDDDVAASVAAIEHATGQRPRGFRAPGYNLSEALLDVLEKRGFAYDSSLMPSPLYYAARALAIRAKGGASHSIVGTAREFFAPRAPFRPRRGRRFSPARSRVEGRDLLEIPIATGALRTPFLGTTLAMLPEPAVVAQTAAALAWSAASAPIVLELHAADFVDVDDGITPALARAQPDLRVRASTKIARIETALRMLARTCETTTMSDLAATLTHARSDRR